MRSRFTAGRRGISLILMALSLAFLIPMVGLVLDAGTMYGARSRMSAAADAAAVAAARSLALGQTVGEQSAAATATARKFFDANFPPGAFLTDLSRDVDVTVSETGNRVRTVKVDATGQASTLLMRYLGPTAVTVRVSGSASRRDVNVVMVLDRSGSMNSNGGCDAIKSAAAAFAMKFSNNRDRVGLVTYSSDSRVDVPLQATPGDFQSGPGGIPAKASEITCDGVTATASGLWRGYEELKRINEAGRLNVIVLMTDGQPNTLAFDLSAPVDAAGWNAIKKNVSGQPAKYATESTCATRAGKVGMIHPFGAGGTRLAGLFQLESLTKVDSGLISGCAMDADEARIDEDLAFVPDRDLHGNELINNAYKAVTVWPAGSPDPGRISPADPASYINAAMNAVDSAGRRIRANEGAMSALDTVIFTLGFAGGVGANEQELLLRVANAASSPSHDSTRPEGYSLYAPDAAALQQAFVMVAGEVLRISK